MKIAQNITQLIGGTPLVALNNIPKKDGSLAKIVLKLESINREHLSLALSNYTHKNQAYH